MTMSSCKSILLYANKQTKHPGYASNKFKIRRQVLGIVKKDHIRMHISIYLKKCIGETGNLSSLKMFQSSQLSK